MGKYITLVQPHLEKGADELNTVIEGFKSKKIDPNTALAILESVSKRFSYISEMINAE